MPRDELRLAATHATGTAVVVISDPRFFTSQTQHDEMTALPMAGDAAATRAGRLDLINEALSIRKRHPNPTGRNQFRTCRE